jgi:predicted patatin/cPLA2 family phospholipase
MTRSLRSIVLLLLVSVTLGCVTHPRTSNCVTCSGRVIDLNSQVPYVPYDPKAIELLAATVQKGTGEVTPVGSVEPRSGKNLLAISGGGMYGAFSVGVLKGWSDAGTRPEFEVVTGVSTGALISSYAFLGPQYDDRLVQFYTQVKSKDIFRERSRIALLWSDSYATSEPLKKLIDATVDLNLLQAVAAKHAEGKRLFVATTNLDTRRSVVWDMGAIASRGDAAALQLYRKVLLASASVPGFFPPVEIEIEVDGRKFTELHVDGGVTTEVFIVPGACQLDPEEIKKGKPPLAGYNLYVLTSGKYYADPQCVDRSLSGIASGTVAALLYAKTRDDLLRLYTICLVTGMKFHVTAVPQDLVTSTDSLDFNPVEMKKLLDAGYLLGRSPTPWRYLPPGTDPEEQTLPRTGTRFATPK